MLQFLLLWVRRVADRFPALLRPPGELQGAVSSEVRSMLWEEDVQSHVGPGFLPCTCATSTYSALGGPLSFLEFYVHAALAVSGVETVLARS